MPSPIVHSAMGVAVAWLHPGGAKIHHPATRLLVLSLDVLLAKLPDFDFVPQLVPGYRVHHTFSHGIVFALAFAAASAGLLVLFRRERFAIVFSLVGLIHGSHVVMDMAGGGPGVERWWPFWEVLVRFPFQVFPSVDYSRGFLNASHAKFLAFELAFSVCLLGGTIALYSGRAWWARRRELLVGTPEGSPR